MLPGEVVLYTGDICTIDEDGFVYFVCRKDDVLKVKGQKVAPKEVEQVLMQHPDVSEAAVVGLSQSGLEDEVVAFVSLREGARAGPPALRTWCGVHLESFMVPGRIVVLGTLPKSANGKTDKLALKNTILKRLEAPGRSVGFPSGHNETECGAFQNLLELR